MQQRPKSCEAGPNPNAATFAYPGKKKAEGQLTIVFTYQKQGCRDDRAKLFSEMHDNRKRANSHKLQQEKF